MEIKLPSQETSSTPEAGIESPEDVRTSTIELVEKHKQRKQRSDKGIPRGPRGVNREAQIQAPPIDPNLQLNIELVKKSLSALVKATDIVIVRKVYKRAIRLGCEEELAKEYGLGVRISEEENQIISECTSIIFARSEWLIKHAPEVMLGCVGIAYTVRILTVLHKLDQIEEEIKKSKHGKKVVNN